MALAEKFLGVVVVLVALGLILKNAAGFNTVVTSAGTASSGVIGQLQAG